MSTLSDNLKMIRIRSGISQNELASVMCVSRNQINNYENDISQPSIEMLFKLCQYFNVTMDAIVSTDLRKNFKR